MEMRGNHRSAVMGRDPIWRLLIKFSGPAIISMMVSSSYNIVDAIFVGRLGPEALAALSVAFPIMMTFMAIGVGTGMGAASLIARRLGAGREGEANNVAGVTITLSILIGGLITAIFLPNLQAMLRLFGANGQVLTLATSYLSVLISFAVVAFFPIAVSTIVRAEGNPILASAVMIVSALTNIALDPIFIFGWGPVPAMGVAGAATATAIARGVGMVVLIIYFVSGKTSYRFRWKYFIPKLKILAEIYRIGLASIVRHVAGAAILVLANNIAASFGVVPLAVVGILFRSGSFAFMPSMGIGQGVLPLVGYNFGAGKKERIGEVVIKALIVNLAWGLFCWLIALLLAQQVMSIFNTDPQFLAEGTRALRIFSLAFFMIGIQIVISFFFQGIGRGLASLIIASARQIIFLLPAMLILPSAFGLTGLWAAFPASDALAIILTLIWLGIEFRRMGIPFRLRYRQT